MRKITKDICEALQSGKPCTRSNTYTDGVKVFLHDNLIAFKRENGLSISLAGWPTATTRERINGLLKFFYENEKDLNPLDYLDIPINNYNGTKEWLFNGKKISIDYLETKDDGKYLILFDDFFSIIEIVGNEVNYLLNKVTL